MKHGTREQDVTEQMSENLKMYCCDVNELVFIACLFSQYNFHNNKKYIIKAIVGLCTIY